MNLYKSKHSNIPHIVLLASRVLDSIRFSSAIVEPGKKKISKPCILIDKLDWQLCFASSKLYKSKHSNISRIVLQYWLLDSIQFSSAIVELEKGKKERSKKCRSTWSGVKYHSAQLLLLKESMCECVLLIYICLKSVYFGISVIYVQNRL